MVLNVGWTESGNPNGNVSHATVMARREYPVMVLHVVQDLSVTSKAEVVLALGIDMGGYLGIPVR